jgi:hypothetical protein
LTARLPAAEAPARAGCAARVRACMRACTPSRGGADRGVVGGEEGGGGGGGVGVGPAQAAQQERRQPAVAGGPVLPRAHGGGAWVEATRGRGSRTAAPVALEQAARTRENC